MESISTIFFAPPKVTYLSEGTRALTVSVLYLHRGQHSKHDLFVCIPTRIDFTRNLQLHWFSFPVNE